MKTTAELGPGAERAGAVLLDRIVAGAIVVAGAAAAAKTVNNAIRSRACVAAEREQPRAPAGEGYYEWSEGTIRFTEAGEGEPLLLLHGLGLGASSFEWRENAGPLSEQFRVYTYDALGYGESAAPALHYSGELYIRLLRDFIRDVVGRPVSVVASALAAACTVALACREPAWFRNLILVCPTGIQALHQRPNAAGRSLYQTLSTPILGESIYNSLTTHARIESYLRHEIYQDGSRVTQELVDHYWTQAHQPGARWPARSYMTGYLNVNILEEFRRLERPVTLAWGQHAQQTPVAHAEAFLRLNPDAELEVFSQAGALPHEERADEFNRMVEERLVTTALRVGPLPRAE